MIIGIDPSSKMPAYAKIDDGKIVDYGKIPLRPLQNWLEIFSGVSAVFIEDQYNGINYRSAKLVTFAAGELSACAELSGCEVRKVAPKRWQSKILRMGGHARRNDLKRQSKQVASAIVGHKIKDPDIADAICIAIYGWIYGQLNLKEGWP